MALDPLTSGLDLAGTILNKFIPDKDLAEKAKEEYRLALLQAQVDADKGQDATNTAEASSSDAYTSRARPTVIYVCCIGLMWAFFVGPLLCYIATVFHWTTQPPVIPMDGLFTLLMSILGLGTLRTVEKVKGVA